MTRADVADVRAAQTESGAILASSTYPTCRDSWLRDGAFCAAAMGTAEAGDAPHRYHPWTATGVHDGILAAPGCEAWSRPDPMRT